MTCTGGFSTSGPFAVGGLWQACSAVTTPVTNNFTLFFDSANSGATSYKNSAGTCAAVSSGGSMVYPGAGVALSTGSAWGTSLTAPVGSTALAGLGTNTFSANQSLNGDLIFNGGMYNAAHTTFLDVGFTHPGFFFAPYGTNPTVVPITLQGSSGQTANLLNIQDSTGTVMASVSANGTGNFPGSCTSFVNAVNGPCKVTITAAQLATINSTTSVQVLPAVAGKSYFIQSAAVYFHFNTTAYTFTGSQWVWLLAQPGLDISSDGAIYDIAYISSAPTTDQYTLGSP